MKIMKMILLFILLFFADIHSQAADSAGLAEMLKTYNGVMVIYNQVNDKYIKFNSGRCDQRFMPASTFKIPNSLIGLETGVIADSNYVIKWNGKPGFIKEWDRDHTLKSAIYYSVVWYYQELARRVGRNKMQYWLNKINYGNNIIGDKVDYFWLDNSLKISANEQVEFLKKLYRGNLPFSKRSLDITKSILPEEDFKNAVLKYKTGTGKYEDSHYIAWLVGYVVKVQSAKDKVQSAKDKVQSSKTKDQSEKDEREGSNVYFFAFNVDTKTFNEAVDLRTKIKNKMLGYLGVNK